MVYAFVCIHADTSLTVGPQTSEGVNFYLGYQMRIELTFQVPQTCVLTVGRPTPYGGQSRSRTYVVSYVTGLQPADIATSHIYPFGTIVPYLLNTSI